MGDRFNFSKQGQRVMRNEDMLDAAPAQYARQPYGAPNSKEMELRQAQQSLSLLKMKMQANGKQKGPSRQNLPNAPVEPQNAFPQNQNPRQPNPQNQRPVQAYSNPELAKNGRMGDDLGGYGGMGGGRPGARQAQSFQDNQYGPRGGKSDPYDNDGYGALAGKKPSIDKKVIGGGFDQNERNNVFGYGQSAQAKGRQGLGSTSTSDTTGPRYNNVPDKALAQTDVGYKMNNDYQYGDDQRRVAQVKSAQNPQAKNQFPGDNRNYKNYGDDDGGYGNEYAGRGGPVQNQPQGRFQQQNQDRYAGGSDANARGRSNYDQYEYRNPQQEMPRNQPQQNVRRPEPENNPRNQPYPQNPPKQQQPMNQQRPGQGPAPYANQGYGAPPRQDEMPNRGGQRGYQPNDDDEDEGEEGEVQNIKTFLCREGCNRRFAEEALEKHERICKKVFQNKRKVFDMTEQRYDDDVLQAVLKAKRQGKTKNEPQKEEKEKKVPKWKLESAQLKMASKQARGENVANTEEAALVKIMEKQDKIDCPTCGRNFSETAGKRHIPFCAEKSKAQKLKQGANATTLKQPLNPKAKPK